IGHTLNAYEIHEEQLRFDCLRAVRETLLRLGLSVPPSDPATPLIQRTTTPDRLFHCNNLSEILHRYDIGFRFCSAWSGDHYGRDQLGEELIPLRYIF